MCTYKTDICTLNAAQNRCIKIGGLNCPMIPALWIKICLYLRIYKLSPMSCINLISCKHQIVCRQTWQIRFCKQLCAALRKNIVTWKCFFFFTFLSPTFLRPAFRLKPFLLFFYTLCLRFIFFFYLICNSFGSASSASKTFRLVISFLIFTTSCWFTVFKLIIKDYSCFFSVLNCFSSELAIASSKDCMTVS